MDKEYIKVVDDLLQHPKVKNLKNITHHKFTNRYAHSVSVSYISYRVGKHLGFSEESLRAIARAGLLHDFFFETREEFKCMKCGSHNYLHPVFALKNAVEITNINALEEDIITKHMFLSTSLRVIPKYKESLLVSLVDKYVSLTDVLIPVTKVLIPVTKVANLPVKETIERRFVQIPQLTLVFALIGAL